MSQSRFYPILIFILGLIITFLISYSAWQDHNKLEMQSMEKFCLNVKNDIQKQLIANAQILYSSAAFISGSDTITRDEWKEFQYLNKSHNELSGILGIGYSVVVDKNKIQQFEKQVRAEGYSEFSIFPATKRDFYTAVLFIEPETDRNIRALGFDAYAEGTRRTAMDHSFDADEAMITDKILLLQDSGKVNTSGMVMFAPVFRKGYNNVDISERKEGLMGWVFSVYQINDLMKSILGDLDYQRYRLEIYDDKNMDQESLIFNTDYIFPSSHISAKPNRILNIPLDYNKNIWILHFANYGKHPLILPPRVLLNVVNGIIITILLTTLFVGLIKARVQTQQIQKLNEELRNVNSNKDRFISLLAHDLKSPFNSLLGFAELLSENLGELKQEEITLYVDRIYKSAQLSYVLLDELLMWARVQSNQFPFDPQEIDIKLLCKAMLKDHALVAQKKNISVSCSAVDGLIVKADELMVKTILRNLIVNAIKFTHPGGSLRTMITKAESKVIVSVIDTGIGISPEEKAMLFEITQLRSKPGTANERGTGLGLMLCKDMVKKNGGEIWVESTPGKGSTFSFSLPLATDME